MFYYLMLKYQQNIDSYIHYLINNNMDYIVNMLYFNIVHNLNHKDNILDYMRYHIDKLIHMMSFIRNMMLHKLNNCLMMCMYDMLLGNRYIVELILIMMMDKLMLDILYNIYLYINIVMIDKLNNM